MISVQNWTWKSIVRGIGGLCTPEHHVLLVARLQPAQALGSSAGWLPSQMLPFLLLPDAGSCLCRFLFCYHGSCFWHEPNNKPSAAAELQLLLAFCIAPG
jgi:hypothetical protein